MARQSGCDTAANVQPCKPGSVSILAQARLRGLAAASVTADDGDVICVQRLQQALSDLPNWQVPPLAAPPAHAALCWQRLQHLLGVGQSAKVPKQLGAVCGQTAG